MEIAQENGGFGARDDQNKVDDAQEAEHVVELMRPDAVEHEKELNENASERQDAAHDDGWHGSRVEILLRNLTRYLIRADWILNGRFLEAQIRAEENERRAHAEPESQEDDERREWYGRRA